MEGLIFGILRYFTDRAKMCKEIHFNPFKVPTMTNFLSLIIITRQYREEKVVKISEIFTKGKVL